MVYVFPLNGTDFAFTKLMSVITDCGAMADLEDKEGEVRMQLRRS